ncbi:hypothetical protein [Roseovarius aestuarii]|uniref:GIY-YIG domain-containing protein n=1 Tax=Roseovarius aestuarii TaxID=475083 RepID=A0A1X7BX96_9RHOB|nr:hypothetical protein [Roseovarius aestuarii]SMC14222.1 hypothetical protein ROA7745_04087 [Roseovarius aestuarii]
MNTTVTWTGNSGSQYRFDVFPVGTQFNPISGVYVACRRLITGQFEALYVGETQSFKDRLNVNAGNHDGLRCAARNGMTHIGAIVSTSSAERLRIETDLRHGLNPSCNKQSVNPRLNMRRR